MTSLNNNFEFLNEQFSSLYLPEEGKAPWRVAATPFILSRAVYQEIAALGDILLSFYKALNKLYLQSVKGQMPAFVAQYIEKGKPESILKMMRQNYHKNHIPFVIRPDILLLEDGIGITELDSVPGGMGFVAQMSQAYSELGYPITGNRDGMLEGFAQIFHSELSPESTIALLISDESNSYLPELSTFVHLLKQKKLLNIHIAHPRDIQYSYDAIYLKKDEKNIKIDGIYRFYELFDLPNIPKHELITYAAAHKKVFLTPPLKAHLEEKMMFAFLWHPELESFWKKELTEPYFYDLCKYFPKTWILDPTEIPPYASITHLQINHAPVSNWRKIGEMSTKKERDFVVKPSGFSPISWGSKGVNIGNSLSKEDWDILIDKALNAFPTNPYIMQKLLKTKKIQTHYIDEKTKCLTPLQGRVRLCPYFFVREESTILGGILATICPIETDIIHGTPEAIMTVCSVESDLIDH